MLGDGVLSTSIENLLLNKKNLLTHSIAHCFDKSLVAEPRPSRKKVVVMNLKVCVQDSPDCLIGLLSNPDVEEILMVNTEDNMVQVLKKRQVLITDKSDFAKLF